MDQGNDLEGFMYWCVPDKSAIKVDIFGFTSN